jgi:hypothetical protein
MSQKKIKKFFQTQPRVGLHVVTQFESKITSRPRNEVLDIYVC